jgi:hypothetical protein
MNFSNASQYTPHFSGMYFIKEGKIYFTTGNPDKDIVASEAGIPVSDITTRIKRLTFTKETGLNSRSKF